MKKKILHYTLATLLCLAISNALFSQSLESNKKVVNRYFDEVINKQKIDLLEEVFSQDYVFYGLENFTETKGIKQLYDFLPVFSKHFQIYITQLSRLQPKAIKLLSKQLRQELIKEIFGVILRQTIQ
jgi:hypothetical protein